MTELVPKALLPVADRPFVDHQLDLFASVGITRVLFSIGHLGELLRAHVGDGSRWGMQIRYADEGSNLRGTGGALRLARDEGLLEPEFLLTYGDSYLPIDFDAVWRTFLNAGRRTDVVMTILRNDGRWGKGNARVDHGKLRYDKLHRADVDGLMTHIDFGLLAVRRSVIEAIPGGGAVTDLSDLLRSLSEHGRVTPHEVHERFYEVGSAEGLADLEEYLRRAGEMPPT